jgi:hypothetical protein
MVAPIGRVQVIMTGFTGAPGLMQFYWNGAAPGVFTNADATAATAAVRALIDGCKAAITTSAGMQVQAAVEVIEATTGALIGIRAATPVALVTGTGSTTVLTAEGPLLQWFTDTVVGRRLLRGRTFFTPSAASAINTSGTVNVTVIASMLTAAATYIASAPAQPVIWHRPVPYATGSNGVAAVIVSSQVPAKVAVLRSRRD